jgi:glycosyltransferase involved in cell wall biosynthesis
MPILLQLNCTANWGSTGKIAEQIGIRAQQNGWNVFMVYGRKTMLSSLRTIRVGSKINPYWHYIEHRVLDHEGLASRYATRQLLRKIKEICPDIIHLHNIHDHWLNYELLFEYLNQTEIKIVWTLHDCWSYTGGCTHYSIMKCNKWQTECKKCDRTHLLTDYSNQQFLLRKKLFTANKNLTLVPVSQWIEGEVRKSFFKDAHIHTIFNGVDLNTFHPVESLKLREQYNLNNKFVLVAAATSWSVSKGLNDYYALSKLLPEDCSLILIGLNNALLKRLPNSIIGIPRTSNVQELVEFYSMADVVMNLSYQESFGLTTIEGFACGTPSIVYNVTASPELVTSDTGFVVDLGNVQSVLTSILQIKSSGKSAYSHACRHRAELYFDKNKNFEKYIELYNSLLKK